MIRPEALPSEKLRDHLEAVTAVPSLGCLSFCPDAQLFGCYLPRGFWNTKDTWTGIVGRGTYHIPLKRAWGVYSPT